MKKILIVLTLLVLVISLSACGSQGTSGTGDDQNEGYAIKISHDLPENSAQHVGLERFKELVEEESAGRLAIEIFPNNTLGTDTEVAEMLQTGSVEAALIPTAKLSGFHAPLQVIDLPFIFPNHDALYGTLDDEQFKEALYGPMESLGFKGINFWESGFKQLTANKPVEKPEDLSGVNVRTMESPLIIAQFEAVGANPIPIDFGETYNSLQLGVVDAQENPLVSITNMRFYEVQSHLIISNHAYLAYAFLFSDSFWDGLPEDLQEIIIAAADEGAQVNRDTTHQEEEGYIKTMEDYGTVVTHLSEESIELFTQAMLSVHEQFRDVLGSDVLDTTYSLVEQYK